MDCFWAHSSLEGSQRLSQNHVLSAWLLAMNPWGSQELQSSGGVMLQPCVVLLPPYAGCPGCLQGFPAPLAHTTLQKQPPCFSHPASRVLEPQTEQGSVSVSPLTTTWVWEPDIGNA